MADANAEASTPSGTTRDVAALWEKIEQNYWTQLGEARGEEDTARRAGAEAEIQEVKLELVELLRERHELAARMQDVSNAIAEKQRVVADAETRFDRRMRHVEAGRRREEARQRAWFRRKRGIEDDEDDEDEDEDEAEDDEYENHAYHHQNGQDAHEDEGLGLGEEEQEQAALRRKKWGRREQQAAHNDVAMEDAPSRQLEVEMQDVQQSAPHTNGVKKSSAEPPPKTAEAVVDDEGQAREVASISNGTGMRDAPVGHDAERGEGGSSMVAEVCDFTGGPLGQARMATGLAPFMDRLQKRQTRRAVRIRSNVQLPPEDLTTMCTAGGSKEWLSCMTQAKGAVQDTVCPSCVIGHGPYAECVVMIPGPPWRCGNCQYTGTECRHDVPAVDPEVEEEEEKDEDEQQREAAEQPTAEATAAEQIAEQLETQAARPAEQKPAEQQQQQQQEADRHPPAQCPTERQARTAEKAGEATPGRRPRASRDGQVELPLRSPSTRRLSQQVLLAAAAAAAAAAAEEAGSPAASGGFTPVNAGAQPSKTGAGQGEAKKARRSLPSGKTEESTPARDTPPAARSRKPRAAPRDIGNADGGDREVDVGPDITQDRLALKHDGVVYQEPEIMYGVPVAKVTPDHAYWEGEWADLEPTTRAELEKWQKKYEIAAANVTPESKNSPKYLAHRQVNRGKMILKYLESGEIHPYQLIGKAFLKKALGYDTVFRFVATLEDLAKFNMEVDPLDWLRQRLHEIYSEDPQKFNYEKTVHDLYGDPKLAALRARNGFGNIGRPSGYKLSKDETPRAVKRKEPHATPKGTPEKRRRSGSGAMPSRDEGRERDSFMKQEQTVGLSPRKRRGSSGADSNSSNTRCSKQARVGGVSVPPPEDAASAAAAAAAGGSPTSDDLAYTGYTSTDSYSKDDIMRYDWRIHQIKTARQTTNNDITQYWHFVDGARELHRGKGESYFEHQVLKELDPPSWGVYMEPIDFHLRLKEITHVTYASDSQHIVIGTKPIPDVEYRGDVLAHFKRDRTKNRFLSFLKKKSGVKLVCTTPKYVEDTWNKMQSEVLAGDDSEENNSPAS